MADGRSIPWHLWVVGALALAWNGLGVWQWYLKTTHSSAYWDALTEAQAAYLRAAPLWTDVAFGVAVWTGVLGALLLLFRRRLAFNAFLAGLVAMVADTIYVHFLSNGTQVMGPIGSGFGLVVIAIFGFEIVYAWRMRRRGVLR